MKILAIALLTLNFTSADNLFSHKADYKACLAELQTMLPAASDNNEKAEVCWRLARVYLLLGDAASDKETKQSLYAEGMAAANEGIAANPSSYQCYMWRSANRGRDCQMRPLPQQAAASSQILSDLEQILDRLGKTAYSEAWEALSQLYIAHPLKSDDAGISYAYRAALTIPKDEIRISTLMWLATVLYDRDDDADDRAKTIKANREKFAASAKSNTAKYAYYEGNATLPWLTSSSAQLSDREEARAILRYAESKYNAKVDKTPVDRQDYTELIKLKNKWN
jgi:hypothetical protein